MKNYILNCPSKTIILSIIASGIGCFSCLPAMAAILTLPSSTEKVLLLDVDVSGSVNNDTEYGLIMGGYENAFRNTDIQNSIIDYTDGTLGTDGITIGLQFWSSDRKMMTDTSGNKWFHLTDAVSINNFADTIKNSSRPTKLSPDNIGGGTNLAGALVQSQVELQALFNGGTVNYSFTEPRNGNTTTFTATNNQGAISDGANLETMIDISTDGFHDRQTSDGNGNTDCDDDGKGSDSPRSVEAGLSDLVNCQAVLADAISAVLTNGEADRINALPILGETSRYRDLLGTYYQDGLTVTGGDIGGIVGVDADAVNPAFVETADSFNDFNRAINAKLSREIQEVPFEFNPSLGLFLSGGWVLGLRYKKNKKLG